MAKQSVPVAKDPRQLGQGFSAETRLCRRECPPHHRQRTTTTVSCLLPINQSIFFLFQTWLTSSNPASYWISGLYFPQGFMTGCLQRHSRKYGVPIDSLKVDFELTDVVLLQEDVAGGRAAGIERNAYKGLTEHEDGVYVHGLFLDAGRIDLDTRRLVDPVPGNRQLTLRLQQYPFAASEVPNLF